MAKPKESGGWGRSAWNHSVADEDKDKDKEEDTARSEEDIEINIDDLHRGLS